MLYNGVEMIRERIKKDLTKAVKDATGAEVKNVYLEHPANPEHGDYSSNVAMTLKGVVAEDIVKHFPKTDYLEKIEIAPPGFINFYLKKEWLQKQVGRFLDEREDYGIGERLKIGNWKLKIQLEFISANPTGPLHVGNARGGFAGDVLASVLAKVGYNVQREYYINDKGGQVEKLAQSVRAYRLHLQGQALQIPEGGYSGEYVGEIAEKLLESGKGVKSLEDLKGFAISEILKSVKKTVARMGVKFDRFFSETSLYESSQAQKAIDFLKSKKLIYEKKGAVWFKSSQFGDEKDRVLIKSDGEMTYLVSDVAYHLDKFEKRGFDKVILFWGADHHGYVPRFMAMIEAIGYKGKAEVELIQLLKLARGGKIVRMSKRAGEYVTVDDILDEIGLDAARFHFLAMPLTTSMTLDLAKAAEQSQKNPVYYVQYANARMHSILAKSQIPNLKSQINSKFKIQKLKTNEGLALIRKLVQFPEVVFDISESHEVHRLPQYATEVADAFHRFYENCRVLSADEELTRARLGLVKATQIVLAETLGLMGITAPERM